MQITFDWFARNLKSHKIYICLTYSRSGDVLKSSLLDFVHNFKILCFEYINPKYALNAIFVELQARSGYHGE